LLLRERSVLRCPSELYVNSVVAFCMKALKSNLLMKSYINTTENVQDAERNFR